MSIGDRLQTIMDEAFGPFPTMTDDALLTQLEAELFEQRQDLDASERDLATTRRQIGEARKALERGRQSVAAHDCRGAAEIRAAYGKALLSLAAPPPTTAPTAPLAAEDMTCPPGKRCTRLIHEHQPGPHYWTQVREDNWAKTGEEFAARCPYTAAPTPAPADPEADLRDWLYDDVFLTLPWRKHPDDSDPTDADLIAFAELIASRIRAASRVPR